jgi:hypothetical protein
VRPAGSAGPEQDGVRLDWRPLGVLAAAVTALAAAGVLPRWPGLLHAVALPPLDLVNDVGALLVHATGWPTFALGVAAAVVVRSAVLALLLGGLTRARLLWALRFYLTVLPFAALAAGLLYGAAAVLFYGLFWAGLLVALLLAAGACAAPWAAPGRLRSGFAASAGAGLRLGTVGAYLALLTGLGALAEQGGPVAAVLLVPVSAALTLAAVHVLTVDPGWRAVRRALAVLPAAGVVAVGVAVARGPAAPPPGGDVPAPRAGSPALMSGIDSRSGSGAMLEIDPTGLGWTCDRTRYLSYAGPGDGQPQADARCPIRTGAPYGPEDTLRSRHQLVPFLEQQLQDAPEPVVVATHSQGVWLVWDAASQGRLPRASALVLVGAFPDHGVAYPADARGKGPGRVGRRLLDAVAEMPRPGGTTAFAPDSPLGSEWLGSPGAVKDVLDRPLPGPLRAVSIPSAFDLPLMRDTHRLPGAVDACPVPVIHPNLPYAPELHDVVVRFVDGRPLPPCPPWRTLPGTLLRHWAVPPS